MDMKDRPGLLWRWSFSRQFFLGIQNCFTSIVNFMRLSEKFDNKNFRVGVSVWATFIQSCKMSQIWQIYLCKDIKKVGVKSLWEYKTGSFLGKFSWTEMICVKNLFHRIDETKISVSVAFGYCQYRRQWTDCSDNYESCAVVWLTTTGCAQCPPVLAEFHFCIPSSPLLADFGEQAFSRNFGPFCKTSQFHSLRRS